MPLVLTATQKGEPPTFVGGTSHICLPAMLHCGQGIKRDLIRTNISLISIHGNEVKVSLNVS